MRQKAWHVLSGQCAIRSDEDLPDFTHRGQLASLRGRNRIELFAQKACVSAAQHISVSLDLDLAHFTDSAAPTATAHH